MTFPCAAGRTRSPPCAVGFPTPRSSSPDIFRPHGRAARLNVSYGRNCFAGNRRLSHRAFNGFDYHKVLRRFRPTMIAKITRTGLTLGLFTALAVTGFAWQQTPSGDGQGGADVAPHQRGEDAGRRYHGKRGGRHHGARGIGRMLSRLNLNDAQREQVRAIMERNFQSTQPQRDELRQLTQQQTAAGHAAQPRRRSPHPSASQVARRINAACQSGGARHADARTARSA